MVKKHEETARTPFNKPERHIARADLRTPVTCEHRGKADRYGDRRMERGIWNEWNGDWGWILGPLSSELEAIG